jgi:hypothetical protein
MRAPEEGRRTAGEAVQPRNGRFVYGFSDDVEPSELLALCGGKGSGLMPEHGRRTLRPRLAPALYPGLR